MPHDPSLSSSSRNLTLKHHKLVAVSGNVIPRTLYVGLHIVHFASKRLSLCKAQHGFSSPLFQSSVRYSRGLYLPMVPLIKLSKILGFSQGNLVKLE